MSEICKKVSRKNLKRNIAWLLIVAIMITCVNPASLVLASKNNSWNVNWTAEVDGEVVESHDNETNFYVEEGQTVDFIMELMEDNVDNTDRFDEKFEIILPEYIYNILTDNGECPIDWDMMTDSVLEAVEKDVTSATGSNARANRESSVGTSSSANKATASDSKTKTRKIKLRFNQELSEEELAEAIEEMGAVYSNLMFEAPEDMVLLCKQTKNKFEIKMTPAASASDALLRPLMSTDSWDASWEFLVNNNKQEEGEDILVEVGDVVKFNFAIQLQNGKDPNYNDTFELTMPTEMYDIMGDFTWQQVIGKDNKPHDLFTSTVTEDVNSQKTIITISFADYFKSGEGKSIVVTGANSNFGFKSEKEVTISYKENEENDSTEITYGEPNIEEPFFKVKKYISDIFNENSQKDSSNAVQNGDYIIYCIDVNLVNGEEGKSYKILPNTIFESFNGNIYDLVNLAHKETAEELLAKIPDDSPELYKKIADIISAEEKKQTWDYDPLDPVPDFEIPNKDKPGYVVYGNLNEYELIGKGEHTETPLSLYICLKVKDDINLNEYKDEDLKNNAYQMYEDNGTGGSAGPTTKGYYDQALQIYPVSIWHKNATSSTLVGNSFNFPEILKNENAAVIPGDYVTFRVRNYEQGSLPSIVQRMEIYLPLGFEPVAELEQLPDNFRYAIDSNNTGDFSGDPTSDNDAHRYLDNNSLSGTFELNNVHKGDPLDYGQFVQIKRYTFEFKEPAAERDIYITCRVKDLDTILADADMADSTENRILAERYGYLISAEISQIADSKTLDIVEDEDSWIDDFPFNDWYDNSDWKSPDVFSYKKLKHDSLYYFNDDGFTIGEKDGHRDQHVRSLTGKWTVTGMLDEDDFDFAIVYLYQAKLTDSKGISKEVRSGNPESKAVSDLLGLIDDKYGLSGDEKYSEKYHTLNNGMISKTQTVIPYVVNINGDGSKTMEDVVFTDKLPETMSFLTLPNKAPSVYENQPVLTIYERIENDGYRFPAIDKDGKPVDIIMEEYSSDYEVKKDIDVDFYKSSEEKCYTPSGVLPDNKWKFEVEDNTLTIQFGDIGDNAYSVVYYVVVDKVSNTYRNSASIEWKDNPKETAYIDFSKWDSGGALGYSKDVLDDNGNPVGESQVDNINQLEGLDLTYRLFITITGDNVYAPYDLVYYDYLDDLFDGERLGKNVQIKDITYRDMAGNKIESNASFVTTVDPLDLKLEITNIVDLKEEVSYIDFTVHYEEIPYGTTIKNTFGVATTKVETPLKLDLTKVDETGSTKLEGAEFALYYDEKLNDPVLDDDIPITFITDNDGKASAEFFLDDSYAHADKTFNLYLEETVAPLGYEKPTTPYIVKLEVTKDANSKYSVTVIDGYEEYFEVSTGDLNEIQIIVNNLKDPLALPSAELKANKTLTGKTLQAGDFTFNAKLVKAVDSSTVISNGKIIADKGTIVEGGSLDPAKNGENGVAAEINFPSVKFDKVGVYVFELSEEIGSKTGIKYDQTKYYAGVEVTEDSVTKVLSAEGAIYYKTYKNGVLSDPISTVPEFGNTYKPDGMTIDLNLKKELFGADGAKISNLPEYTFTVSLIDGEAEAVKIPEATVKNTTDGEIKVEGIEITKEGTYKFSIQETSGDNTGIDYDKAVIEATVIVTDESGKLKASVPEYHEAGTDKVKETFVNTIRPIEAGLKATKTLSGRTQSLEANEFTFDAKLIKAADGSTVISNGKIIADKGTIVEGGSLDPAKNGENGVAAEINFPSVKFDKVGVYVFELSEEIGSKTGIKYDQTKYYAQVKVSEDPTTNKLKADVTYHKSYNETTETLGDSITSTVPEFKNTYTTNSSILKLQLNKKLYDADGTEKTNLPEYTFKVSLDSGTANAVTIPQTTVTNTAAGLIEVNNIKITQAGTYVFKIEETSGSNAGIIYDKANIKATVVVQDMAGTLEVTSTTYEKSKLTGYEGKDTFVNIISSTKAGLKADKTLTGRDLKSNEFTFNAKLIKTISGSTVKSDNKTIALNGVLKPVKNALDGTIEFPEVEFNKAGSYIFELSEENGSAADINYDKTKYYAQVKVSEDSATKQLNTDVTYHKSYDKTTQTVGDAIASAVPEFENAVKGSLSIKKVSKSSGRPLTGAKFTISYQLKDSSSNAWTALYTDLETNKSDGTVSFELPDKHWTYKYKLVETKAPSGYSKSRVGTIFFTVAQDGTIDSWSNDGTSGYVELSDNKTALIVKNHTTGGGGGGNPPDPTKPDPTKPDPTKPDPTDPSPTNPTPTDPELPTIPYDPDPDKPGIIVPPGDIIIEGPEGPVYEGKTPDGYIDIELPPGRYVVTVIDENGIPLSYFMDVPVPLSGLARTGDSAVSAIMLAAVMTAAIGAFGAIMYAKRKDEKSE